MTTFTNGRLVLFLMLFLLLLCVNSLNYETHTDINPEDDEGTCTIDGNEDSCQRASSIKESLEESIEFLDVANSFTGSPIYTIITFKNVQGNTNLQRKFRLTVTSLLTTSSVGIIFLIIGDQESQTIAKSILSHSVESHDIATTYRVADVDSELMAKELHAVVEPMQSHFSSKPGAYYSDSLFFLSIAIHRVLPDSIDRVIMIDADLKFKTDISQLYALFDEFTEDNIMGIARENQPVYRHTFSYYRTHNPGTRVGEPPPSGLTGFNSGVLLLNLNAMRNSDLYNSLITQESLVKLTNDFHFKGHLGDQDFFTLISMDYEQLFYILPCGWNRQLCTWWRAHGYESVFDLYYDCDGSVHIYHGNCNTEIHDD